MATALGNRTRFYEFGGETVEGADLGGLPIEVMTGQQPLAINGSGHELTLHLADSVGKKTGQLGDSQVEPDTRPMAGTKLVARNPVTA